MKEKNEVDQRLQRLLKSRQIPVDEGQLEAIYTRLLKRLPVEEPLSVPGIFHQYRAVASLAVLFVMIGLLFWTFDPLSRNEPTPSVFSALMTVAADDEQLDHALVLLSGFASDTVQGGSVVDWEIYNRTLLSDDSGESLLEAFYINEPS